jgi:hypothetical protein
MSVASIPRRTYNRITPRNLAANATPRAVAAASGVVFLHILAVWLTWVELRSGSAVETNPIGGAEIGTSYIFTAVFTTLIAGVGAAFLLAFPRPWAHRLLAVLLVIVALDAANDLLVLWTPYRLVP